MDRMQKRNRNRFADLSDDDGEGNSDSYEGSESSENSE